MHNTFVLIAFWGLFISSIQAQVSDSTIRESSLSIDSTRLRGIIRYSVDSKLVIGKNLIKADSSKKIIATGDSIPTKGKRGLCPFIISWFDNFIHPKLQDTVTLISDATPLIIQEKRVIHPHEPPIDTIPIIQQVDTVKRNLLSIFKYWNNDSLHTPALLLRPYIENGMLSFINDSIKSIYATKTIYSYGFGFQIGHIRNHSIIPYTQFSFAKTAYNKNTLTINHISVGLYLPIYRVNESYLAIKLGYCLVMLKESKNTIHQNIPGFQAGMYLDHKLGGNTRIYVGYSYYYEKSPTKNFKDFDVSKVTFGIIL